MTPETVTDPKVKESPPERVAASDDYLKAVSDVVAELKTLNSRMEKLDPAHGKEMIRNLNEAGKKNRHIDGGPEGRKTLDEIADQNDGTWSLRDLLDAEPTEELHRQIKTLHEEMECAHLIYSSAATKGLVEYAGPKSLARQKKWRRLANKANDLWSGVDGLGGDWQPIGMLGTLIDVFRLGPSALNMFTSVVIPQGVQSMSVPVRTSVSSWRPVLETTDASTAAYPGGAQAPTTAQMGATDFIPLIPKKLKGLGGVSNEFQEDAVVAGALLAEQEMTEDGLQSLEAAFISGQSANQAALDGANGPVAANGFCPASPPLTSLRRAAIVGLSNATVNVGGVLDVASLISLKIKLRKYSARTSNAAYLLGAEGFNSVVTDAQVLTVDKLGAGATLITGQVASLLGHPIMLSEQIPTNLDAAGKAAVGGTLTTALMLRLDRWRAGRKRNLQIRGVEIVQDDFMLLVGFLRACLAAAPQAGSEPPYAAAAINVNVG